MAIAFAAASLVERVGWLLVHSVWQFALIAIVLAVVLRMMRGAPAGARYAAALVGWGLMLIAPAVTWPLLPEPVPQSDAVTTAAPAVELAAESLPVPADTDTRLPTPAEAFDATVVEVAHGISSAPANVIASPVKWAEKLAARIAPWLNTLVVIWCAGVCLFGARSARGWFTVQGLLRRDVVSVPDEMTTLLVSVLKRVGLHHRVRLLQSPHVDVPLVVGWLRPVILLPVCVATGFSPAQLEAVLAHELAHIRRHDYLINLLQNLSETVFFYHPALWWASAFMRREREHCCDELAARALGNRAEYGRALLALEELRGTTPSLALGAKGGSLLERIRRLAREPDPRLGAGGVAVGIGIAAAVVLTAVVWTAGMADEQPAVPDSTESKVKTSVEPEAVSGSATDATRTDSKAIGPLSEVSVADQVAKYAFEATIPADHHLWISLTEVPARRGYAGAGFRLVRNEGGSAHIELAFEYLKKSQGSAANPLLSTAERIAYDWSAPGCEPPAAGSFVDVPLFETPTEGKRIVLVDPASEMAKAEQGTRLLLIIPKDANPQTRAEVEAIQPRGEIVALLRKIEPAPAPPSAEQRLLARWRSQLNAIGTSYVRFRRLVNGAGSLQPRTQADVAEMFARDGEPVTAEEALEAARGLFVDGDSRPVFGPDSRTYTFRSVGNKTLETSERNEESDDIRYYDGEIDLSYSAANRQLDVHGGGGSRIYRLSIGDFHLPSQLEWLNKLDVTPRDDSRLQVRSGPFEFVVNENGFVDTSKLESPKSTTTRTTYQFDPETYAGGVVLPRLRIELKFDDDALVVAKMTLVEEARINDGFAPDDFRVALPGPITVVDYRGRTENPRVYKQYQAIEDAAAHFAATSNNKATEKPAAKPADGAAAAEAKDRKAEASLNTEGASQHTEWVAKLLRLKNHNQTAFAIGPTMLSELESDEALAVTREAWPRINVDQVKTGLLKTFEFDRHPHVLEVLDLGATDESEDVRKYAAGYLQNYAFRDFGGDRDKYAAWRKETAGKPVLEVIKANAEWFVADQKSKMPADDQRWWTELETMLNVSGNKSSYPEKAMYLRDAGFVERLRKWADDPQAGPLVQTKSAELIRQIEEAIAAKSAADGEGRPSGEGAARSGDRPQQHPAPADWTAIRESVKPWLDDAFQIDDAARRDAAIEAVRVALNSDDVNEQRKGLVAFSSMSEIRFDKASFHDVIARLLGSADGAVRATAARSLVIAGLRDGDRERLVALVSDADKQVRETIASSIVEASQRDLTGPPAGDSILKLLNDAEESVRIGTMHSMWGVKLSPEIESRIIEISRTPSQFSDGEPYQALYYVLSTQQTKSEASVKRLIEYLSHQDTQNVAGRAAWGLMQGVAEEQYGLVADAALKVVAARSSGHLSEMSCALVARYAGPGHIKAIRELLGKLGGDGDGRTVLGDPRTGLEEALKSATAQEKAAREYEELTGKRPIPETSGK